MFSILQVRITIQWHSLEKGYTTRSRYRNEGETREQVQFNLLLLIM